MIDHLEQCALALNNGNEAKASQAVHDGMVEWINDALYEDQGESFEGPEDAFDAVKNIHLGDELYFAVYDLDDTVDPDELHDRLEAFIAKHVDGERDAIIADVNDFHRNR